MVKSVVGDETQLKLAEDRLTRSSLPSQVGLVIGKLNSKLDRGFVFDLVPTPPNDAGEPPCSVIEDGGGTSSKKKSSSAKTKSLFIDTDWVSEHARQVSRMLLGGIKVVGIYIWVNESLFKNSTIPLSQAVKGVAEAASMMTDGNERLLIHISYSPLRWTCRNCSLAANITLSSLRPCDFKMSKVLGSLQTFGCTYNFDIRHPIARENESDVKRFVDVLRDEITIHAKELTGAKALINGELVIEDEQCVSDEFHQVEFILPFLQDKYMEACSQKEILGTLVFSGSVCSLAYLNLKESVSQALVDIKEDIIRSLHSRLDILCDEADTRLEFVDDGGQKTNSHLSTDKPVPHFDLQVQGQHNMNPFWLPNVFTSYGSKRLFSWQNASTYHDGDSKCFWSCNIKQCNLSFPRRVFVPWLDGTYICDYIQSSETMEVLKDHCVELMSLEFPTDESEILEPESEAPSVIASTAKSFWDVATDCSSAAKLGKSLPKNVAENMNGRNADAKLKLAILVLILSIVVGRLVLYVNGAM